MGRVWMAEQTSPVVRRVALKVVKLGMDTKAVVARFEAERQALALMDHPHIARVLDAGSTDAGRPFFVMDLVRGDAITRYADKHNLDIPARLELFRQVCAAVQHAHQKGVIHRDLKPGNVLVATEDGRPFAKVIDFGIAKAVSQRLTDKTLFTQHGGMIGTLEYMSPEQADGSLDVDTRSDVYSLGVILYELLTGVTPLDRTRFERAALAEWQRVIREEEPQKPSTRVTTALATSPDIARHRRAEPRRLGTLMRGELDWVVMKALEKDRSRRYESAGAFADDVERHLSGEPVTAAPPSTLYRLRKLARRHRGPALAAAAVLLALTLGLVATLAYAAKATHEAMRADRQAEAAEEQRDRAIAAEDRAVEALATTEQAAYVASISAAASAFAVPDIDAAKARLDAAPPHLRNWEWNWLHASVDGSLSGVPNQAGTGSRTDDRWILRTVALDGDEANGPRSQIKVHDDLGNLIASLDYPRNSSEEQFLISPRGKFISASFTIYGEDPENEFPVTTGGKTIVWNTDTWKIVFEDQDKHATHMAFSPDETHFAYIAEAAAAVGVNATPVICTLGNDRHSTTTEFPGSERASGIAFRDDRTLLAVTSEGNVFAVDINGKAVEEGFSVGTSPMISPDGSRIVGILNEAPDVGLWDSSTGALIAQYPAPDSYRDSILYQGDFRFSFSPKGRRLVIQWNIERGDNESIATRFVDAQTGRVTAEFPPLGTLLEDTFAFDSAEERVAWIPFTDTASRFNVRELNVLRLDAAQLPAKTIVLSGSLFGFGDGGRVLLTDKPYPETGAGLQAWSADYRTATTTLPPLSGDVDGWAANWLSLDAEEESVLHYVRDFTNTHAGGQSGATITDPLAFRATNLTTLEDFVLLPADQVPLASFAWHAADRVEVSQSGGISTVVGKSGERREVGQIAGTPAAAALVNGSRIFVLCDDGTLEVCDLITGSVFSHGRVAEERVWRNYCSLVVSDDSKYLAVCEGELSVFQLPSMALVSRIERPTSGGITSGAFNLDNTMFAAGTVHESAVLLLRTPAGRPRGLRRLGRRLLLGWKPRLLHE